MNLFSPYGKNICLAPLPAPLMIRAITLGEMPQNVLGTLLPKDLPLWQGEAASGRCYYDQEVLLFVCDEKIYHS